MDTKRTATRPKPSGTTPSSASGTSTARKASVAKPATPQPTRSAATPTPPATSTKAAKKPGPPATSTSTSSASKTTTRGSTPVPASSTPAKSGAAGKRAVIERVDASTDTIDLNDDTSQSVPGNEEDSENETPAQTITRLSAQLAALSESETSIKNALDARDIEFYMLRSEYDTHLANAESKQSSFASELNSESVFETLQAENQTLQRQLSAMRREMNEAVDAVKSEMSSRESSLQDDLEVQLESLSVENATLKSNIAAQTAQLQSLLQELTHIKESNHAKDFELARSARDYLTLQQQVSRASMVEAAKLDELEFARESIESGRARIRELEQHLEACLNELKVVRLELLALSKSKSVEDANQSNAGTNMDLLLQLQQLQEARVKDDEQLSALEKRVVELSQERDSLLSQVAATNDSADAKEQIEQEHSKVLETRITALSLERDELAALVEKSASEAIAAVERAVTAESSLAALSQTAAAESSVADAPPSVHWAAAKAAELEVEMETLRKTSEQDREAALEAASFFEAEKAALLSELATLKATHEQSLEELNQKVEELSSANAQHSDAADSSSLTLLQTRMEALESELMSAQDESTVQMTQFTQEKASLLQQIEKLTKEVSKLTASFSQQTESLKETLTAQFETNKNVAIAAAIAEMESENSNLTQKISKLEATHSQERAALDSFQDGNVDALAKRATEAESRVEALMAERADLLTASQREYAESAESEELLLLRKEVETLRETQKLELAALKSLQSAASELTAPHSQITTLEANLHQAIVEAKAAKERATLLENAQHQIRSQLETTQAESQTLQITQYQHISQISDLESRVESLKSDLAEAHVLLTSLSSTHTLLVEQHGELQTSQIDQELAKGSLADQELNAAKRELQAAVAESAQLGAQLQSATEKLLAEGEKVVALERQLEVLAGANKMERSDAFLATRRLALDASNSVEDRLMAFEKLVSELEVQLVSKVRSPPPSPGVLSADIPSVE
ncbi:hypothetical protein HDU81_009694 [Chytriomyces hyalinus]|nr:hypothetical protein HDU81_009694 [Chytriomyces hyalinus]